MSQDSYSSLADYDYIIAAVQPRFTYTEHYLREDGTVEFKVGSVEGVKEKFKELISEIKSRGLVALLRRVNEDTILAVGKDVLRIEYRSRTPIILLIATVTIVAIDGWFGRTASLQGQNRLLMTALYTAAVMGIIGIHELGHKVVSRIHNMKSSLPYFIPGIPTLIPTMGAVIVSAKPPINRDSLFDLGLSGPIAGLIVTFIVAIGGALTSYFLPTELIARELREGRLQGVNTIDFFTNLLLTSFGLTNPPSGKGLIISPLLYASSLGFLITFLNLMPAWQLDGGHIARAFFDKKKHRIATLGSVAILFVLRFYFMALIVLVLSARSPAMRPLDDVSSLSRKRRFAFLGVLSLAGFLYVFTILNNPFFFV